MQTNSLGKSETDAHPGIHHLEIGYSGSPIRDRAGKVIGAFEVVTDQTAIKKAARIARKVSDFQNVEISRLNRNLEKIAEGNLAVNLSVEDADTDTLDTREKFATISVVLSKCVSAIRALIVDADMLAKSAVEGRLETRAESARHQGLQEMSSMSRQNAGNAQQARGLADQARRNSERGVESMKKLKEAIDQIKHSSDKTSRKVNEVMDEIATASFS